MALLLTAKLVDMTNLALHSRRDYGALKDRAGGTCLVGTRANLITSPDEVGGLVVA